LIAGALLLLLGSLFVLQNLGMVHVGRLGDYWPLLLVWIGLSRIFALGRAHHVASGVAIAALGVFFQLERLDLLWIPTREVWPVFLVIAGLALIADSWVASRSARPDYRSSPPSAQGGHS
jgi:hypothetical protein